LLATAGTAGVAALAPEAAMVETVAKLTPLLAVPAGGADDCVEAKVLTSLVDAAALVCAVDAEDADSVTVT
jgi:hypothetical protein